MTDKSLTELEAEYAELDSREGLVLSDVQRLFDLGMEIERRTAALSNTTKDQKLKAYAAALAGEIETRAQARIARGMSRERALMLTVMEMSGKITIVKG